MTKFCEWCGKPLSEDSRTNQRFCSDKSTCRVAAWRARKAKEAWSAIQDNNERKIFYQR